MALRKHTNAYWQKRSTERVALLERQSEPYIRKVIYRSVYMAKDWLVLYYKYKECNLCRI